MGNILIAEVTIRGTKPLLWHAFGPDTIPVDGKKEKTGVAGNDPEEWKRSYLATKEGQLYVDPSYIFGMIRDGAKYTKKGRGSLQGDMAATLQVLDEVVLVDRFLPEGTPSTDKTEPVYLDIRSVRNPATRGRNVRYRLAASPGWQATFRILWDKTIIARGQMEPVIIDAGRLSGLGDGRSIGFGRFELVSFKVAED